MGSGVQTFSKEFLKEFKIPMVENYGQIKKNN
jgi:hypothetical protein